VSRLDKFADGFAERQERRKMLPQWFFYAHFLIFILSLLSSYFSYLWLIVWLHGYLHGGELAVRASDHAQQLMFIPIIVGTFGPCSAIANFLEWAIKPMRDTWNRVFDGVQGASLSDALRATYWLLGATAVCLAVSVVGAIDPWQR
jgi:hypothetical protein